MKGKLVSYIAGVVTALTITALPIAASASDGALTLTVTPSRMEVNGSLFQPKAGLVFTADGTAYAPVGELAELLGAECSYDETENLVRVATLDVQVNEDFSSQWTVRRKPVTNYGDEKIFTATYSGALSMDEFRAWWKALGPEAVSAGAEQLAANARSAVGGNVTMYFDYSGFALGTAYAREGYATSHFDAASVWIK